MSFQVRLFAVLFTFAALPAGADVIDAASNGFTVSNRVTIAASPARVYGAAIGSVSQWWNPDHTLSGESSNLSIDPRPGGCFCERLGDDGGVVHLTVTFVNPGVVVRLSGGLGPLGLMGVSGNLTWEFEESEGKTELTWTYAVGGYLDGGLDVLAPAVDGVLLEQMTLLRQFVENGD